jgi:hypothetical protein
MTHHYNPNLAASVTVTGQQILMPMITKLAPAVLAYDILGVQPMTGSVGEIFTMKANFRYETKYKFSRTKWYEADYDWIHYGEVNTWCKEQFGPHDKNPDAWSRWDHKYEGRIYFRDEKDYVLFMLRWA